MTGYEAGLWVRGHLSSWDMLRVLRSATFCSFCVLNYIVCSKQVSCYNFLPPSNSLSLLITKMQCEVIITYLMLTLPSSKHIIHPSETEFWGLESCINISNTCTEWHFSPMTFHDGRSYLLRNENRSNKILIAVTARKDHNFHLKCTRQDLLFVVLLRKIAICLVVWELWFGFTKIWDKAIVLKH